MVLQKIKELEQNIALKQSELDNVPAARDLPDISGYKVIHRMFGEGEVKEVTDENILVSFSSADKKFIYPDAFVQGFLSIEAIDFKKLAEYNTSVAEQRRIKEDELKQLYTERDHWEKEVQ